MFRLGLVSVVIPTRDRPRLLLETVISVAAETYRPMQLIVVDDGSEIPVLRAEIEEACKSFASMEMAVIRNPASPGRGTARNRGLAVSRGEFVFFLDDDDLVAPQAIEHLRQALDAHPEAVAATCGLVYFGHWSGVPPWPRRTTCRERFWDAFYGVPLGGAGVLYRTEVLRRVGGLFDKLEVGEDRVGGVRVASQGPYVVLPDRHKLVRTRGADNWMDHLDRDAVLLFLEAEARCWAPQAACARLDRALAAVRYLELAWMHLMSGRRRPGFTSLVRALCADPLLVRATLWMRVAVPGVLKAFLSSGARASMRRLRNVVWPPTMELQCGGGSVLPRTRQLSLDETRTAHLGTGEGNNQQEGTAK